MREIRMSGSMRGCRKRAVPRRACALLYRVIECFYWELNSIPLGDRPSHTISVWPPANAGLTGKTPRRPHRPGQPLPSVTAQYATGASS